MITSKELQFVDARADKVPVPGEEYCKNIMEDLKKCYETYDKIYKDREYNIIFSNSDEVKFSLLPKNLCHMLGIDFQNIIGNLFTDIRKNVLNIKYEGTISSYDLLTSILENSDKVIKNDCDSKNNIKLLNYYKSGIKCAIFNKLSDFDKFNFAAINFIGSKDNIDYNNTKLLFMPSNEAVCPYFIMGIKKSSENENMYIVSTLLAPFKPINFFQNQEVIIPTQILVSNNNQFNKIVATPEEKLKLLNMYKNIVNEYKISSRINIYGDYEATLNDYSNSNRILSKTK